MSRILHHVDRKDFKKTRQRQIGEQKKCDAQKLKEWQEAEEERKQIEEAARPYKSDWREEINLQESDWTPVAGSIANSSSQTFQYGGEGGPIATFSGLGGVEAYPSTVSVSGETLNTPDYSQLGLQGYAPPLGNVNRRRDYEDVNPRLDASQEFAQKVGADEFMNARLDTDRFDQSIQARRNKLDAINKASEDINKKYQKLNSELYDEYFDKAGIKKNAYGIPRNVSNIPYNLRKELDVKLQKNEDARQREFDALMNWNNSPITASDPDSVSYNGDASTYDPSIFPNEPNPDVGTSPNEPAPTPDDDVLDLLSKLPGLSSAKNFVDHYIDNFVKGDGKQDQNLTNLLSKDDLNYLKNTLPKQPEFRNLRPQTNVQDVLGRVMKNAPRGIRNSIGNGSKLDMDYYNRTGDYKIDKDYVFTQEADLEYRGLPGNLLTKHIINAPKNYAKLKMDGDISPLIQNPMRFHVIIPGPRKKRKVEESTFDRIRKHR